MTRILQLKNRGVVCLSGPDSRTLLQGLITNDIDHLGATGAIYAALLTPQGKFLFDMIIVADGDDLLLDIEAERKPDLIRRLMMYKLRADVEITDDDRTVWALFDGQSSTGVSYSDPRHKSLHTRVIAEENPAPQAKPLADADYEERRIRHGVPDGSRDMKVEKDFWLETGAEKLNGVSFTKGCFVGQELTARMKHRTTLKKSLMPIKAASGPLVSGAVIKTSDDKAAGEVRSVSGCYGLAYLRLEHADKDLTADGNPVTPLSPAA